MSDIAVTLGGSYLFTLGANPYVLSATVIAGNTRPGQFNIKPGRFHNLQYSKKWGF